MTSRSDRSRYLRGRILATLRLLLAGGRPADLLGYLALFLGLGRTKRWKNPYLYRSRDHEPDDPHGGPGRTGG